MTYDLSRAHLNNPFRQPVFHPVTEWVEPDVPVNGSAWLGFGRGPAHVDTEVVHYPGSRLSERQLSPADADVAARLRASNRSSWANRGYALYYNFDLPINGDLWEIRGFRWRNAANADDDPSDGNENNWSFSVHTILQKLYADDSDLTVEPTWDQLETLRWLRWEAREYAVEATGDPHFELNLLPHRDIKPTGCPGDKMTTAIRAGVLNIPARDTTQVPPSTPIPGGKRTMKVFQPHDVDAEFMGLEDEHGNVPVLVWISTAKQQHSRDEYIANHAEVDRGPRLQGFTNSTLLGPLPTGDTRKTWTADDFFSVVG